MPACMAFTPQSCQVRQGCGAQLKVLGQTFRKASLDASRRLRLRREGDECTFAVTFTEVCPSGTF